ncbi:MAG: ABC transporter ATP-binding protein [Candidatus Binatia bacterium]|jgi:ATP-binding cassette subfamily B protein|nr:ABC transporter ATP-binding protein [Candidatus Binatia bacterium]
MDGMQRLRSYLWRYWRRYLLGVFCLFGTATLVMTIPWWIRAGVSRLEQGGPMEDVAFYALVIAGSALAQGVVRTFSRFVIFNVGREVEYDLRNDLFAHLLKLSLSYYHTQRTGDLMSRVINDISSVRLLLGPGILNLINAPLYYLYAIVLMFSMDVRMTLVVLLIYPILIWAFRNFRGRIQRVSLKVQQQMSALSSHVQENLSGMHVVKAYAREQNQTLQFVELNDEYQKRNMDMARLRGLITPFMQAVSGLTILIVIWYGGIRVVAGDLMIADLVAFIAYLNILAWPTAAFGWMLALVERGRAAMERLEEVFKAEPEIISPSRPLPPGDSTDGIEFCNVCFTYEGPANGAEVLKNINFKLPYGRKLGIVGRTGAGKSTLAQLIPRLYDVTSGEIRVGGRDVRSLSLSKLRRLVGFVPQDPFLFSTSLESNLAFGEEGASRKDIEEAVRVARLDRDVEIFPQGLGTIVGERGVALSGGQKQRATLGRTLLLNPPIIILDDCLSSVDAQTEDEILQGLRGALEGKTCIIISHRISAVKDSDEILVLDEGEIVERGNHQALLQVGGIYADIHQQQQLSEELERI